MSFWHHLGLFWANFKPWRYMFNLKCFQLIPTPTNFKHNITFFKSNYVICMLCVFLVSFLVDKMMGYAILLSVIFYFTCQIQYSAIWILNFYLLPTIAACLYSAEDILEYMRYSTITLLIPVHACFYNRSLLHRYQRRGHNSIIVPNRRLQLVTNDEERREIETVQFSNSNILIISDRLRRNETRPGSVIGAVIFFIVVIVLSLKNESNRNLTSILHS